MLHCSADNLLEKKASDQVVDAVWETREIYINLKREPPLLIFPGKQDFRFDNMD